MYNPKIEIITPKPFEVVSTKFTLLGKIPKEFLSYGKYGLGVGWKDGDGYNLPMGGPRAELFPNIFSRFKKKLKFYSFVDLSYFNPSEHPRGLIIEITGDKKDSIYRLPVIIAGTNKEYDLEQEALRQVLANTLEKVKQYEIEWKSYLNELHKIRSRIVDDQEILKGVFEIFDKSVSTFEPFTISEEENEERALYEKYEEVIHWHGPLLRGVAGRMAGFDFRVYSEDHRPQHFHAVHKGRGINARFTYPEIKLLNTVGRNTIGPKEIEKICEYFNSPQNRQKLEKQFQKQILS